MFFLSSVKGWT